MEKLDLTKKYNYYYSASLFPEIQQIGAVHYLSIVGKGDPDGQNYADRVAALFSVAYALKFAAKATGQDFVVPKLEGLWWFEEEKYGHVTLAEAPMLIPRSEWQWRMMIRMPEFVGPEMLAPAIENVITKKSISLAGQVKWFQTPPERVVQIMHVGPFDREPETLAILQRFVEEHGLKKAGLHHEIYLSDIRRAAPEKWRTILREPVC